MENAVNIVLIHRTGGDFKMADAYLLASHILKYWKTYPFPNIYCYTNSVSKELKTVGLTIRPLPNKDWKGWWSKMNLFSPELKDLRPFLYLDLDTVILKSVKTLIPPKEEKDKFVTLRDFYRPNNLASAVMWIPDTKIMDNIYSRWVVNSIIHSRKFRGDQDFIASITKADIYWQDICQPEYVTTFKPNGKWRTELPKQSAVVCFHGKPRIGEAAKSVEWVKSYVSYEI